MWRAKIYYTLVDFLITFKYLIIISLCSYSFYIYITRKNFVQHIVQRHKRNKFDCANEKQGEEKK